VYRPPTTGRARDLLFGERAPSQRLIDWLTELSRLPSLTLKTGGICGRRRAVQRAYEVEGEEGEGGVIEDEET
jgi:hypothetical protein